MARKYDLITDLYERTINSIIEEPTNWMDFLKTAGRNFRLRFDEQLLVYAQRPDAIAVLEIEKWNEKFNRWVNKGAKGIAVFSDVHRERQYLNHYFDISDTHPSRYARAVPIWNMKKEYEKDVIETLNNTFGETEFSSLIEVIKESISNGVEDNINDYVNDLESITFGTNLEYLSKEDIREMYTKLIKNSVSYMIMERLGIDGNLYYSSNDFKDISSFNSLDTINAIGFATSDIAEMGLLPISKTINAIEKQNRTFVSSKENIYNEVTQKNERSNDDERYNLHDDRRLQSTEFEPSRTEGSDTWKVVNDEREISQGTSQDPLLQSINQRETSGTLSNDSRRSNKSRGESIGQDGERDWSNRGNESSRYDELGTNNERSSSFNRGDSEGRNNLRLEDITPLPTINEQLSFFDNKAELSSAFSIPQEVIDATLISGSGFQDGKMRIYEQFQKSLSAKENADFLKNEYGIGGSTHAGGFEGYNQDHDSKGLLIRKGYDSNAPKALLKWNQVANRINELINYDRYLNAKEKEHYPIWLEEETLKRLEIEERMRNREILSQTPVDNNRFNKDNIIGKELTIDNNLFVIESISDINQDVSMRDVTFQNTNGFPINRVEKLSYVLNLLNEQYPEVEKIKETSSNESYEYHLGDKVYIGSKEYEINYFDDNRVLLFDYESPLFNKELPRDEFDLRVKENPLNDHLKVINVIPQYDLAARLVDFAKDYDFYEYQDNLKVGESDEDVIRKTQEKLSDSETLQGIIDYLENIYPEDLNDDQKVQVEEFLTELKKIEVKPPERNLIEEAKKLINDYCYEEFEYGADFSDLSNIGVAYTETDEGYPIQAIVDLVNYKIETEVMGVITHLEEFRSLEDIVDNGLPNLNFSDLIYINDEDEKKIDEVVNDTNTKIVPNFEKKKTKVKNFDLHPETPTKDRLTFDLRSHPVEVVSKKERFERNIKAIELLKTLESEGRFANASEQEILSKYVGWGGIPEAFDERNSSWANEYLRLKSILNDEEYVAARESTLTAFYTPPVVISAIYKAMEQMGFKTGNILEPSCGIGNFIGMLPSSMSESKVYGVELDKISAGIAQQLYQKSSIAPLGFEEVNVPDSFFDAVIGNVPFGDFKVLDKRYDKYNFLIHDYFFGATRS